ncbi:Sodium/glucose cotransporter 4 [Lonchura striata]|uniref:Sodium/glucose cotransporter 4 n=1 Tax=Lonchura striata TaxID=40157 RepID=A0A218VFP8_9PASE|nr:Sodium/glucose cotransporter 4 [Lonchura striata domestica]
MDAGLVTVGLSLAKETRWPQQHHGDDEAQCALKSSVRGKITILLTAMSQLITATMELPGLPGDTAAAFAVADITMVALYLSFLLAVGIRASPFGGQIGASLMLMDVGSGSFIGLVGTAAAGALMVGGFEWNAIWPLLALGWIFVPVYITAGVVTMPEYLKKRFGGQRLQFYMSVLSLILYISTRISTDIFAGGLFIQTALGWNLYLSTVILLAVTAVYTIAGGLAAVIYTDVLQTLIMVLGALVLMFVAAVSSPQGGFISVKGEIIPVKEISTLPSPVACGLSSEWWQQAAVSEVMVQRSLSAKNLSHAKGGSVLVGYLKLFPVFFRVMPGMISRALFPVGCVDPDICKRICGAAVGCSNIAYPTLVTELMPDGLWGLMIAVMMAALMGSLTSVSNSSSTLFVVDIWQRLCRQASEQQLMVVGRVLTLILVVISILWIPVVQSANSGKLFAYIQPITSYLCPPVTALFILAIFCKRINEPLDGLMWWTRHKKAPAINLGNGEEQTDPEQSEEDLVESAASADTKETGNPSTSVCPAHGGDRSLFHLPQAGTQLPGLPFQHSLGAHQQELQFQAVQDHSPAVQAGPDGTTTPRITNRHSVLRARSKVSLSCRVIAISDSQEQAVSKKTAERLLERSLEQLITEMLWSSVKSTVVVLKSLGRAEQCLESLDTASDQLGCAYTAAMDQRLMAPTGSSSR